jgi:hypothetical protein
MISKPTPLVLGGRSAVLDGENRSSAKPSNCMHPKNAARSWSDLQISAHCSKLTAFPVLAAHANIELPDCSLLLRPSRLDSFLIMHDARTDHLLL